MPSSSSSPPSTPASILILGSGVFGLSTLHALLQRPAFRSTHITLVEPHAFPAPHTASIDNTRIIRADYADPCYARLAASAQTSWRDGPTWDHAYRESGLLLTVDAGGVGGRAYVQKALRNVGALEAQADVCEVRGAGAVTETMRARGVVGSGDHGYVNWRSGWADAEVGMRALRARVEGLARGHAGGVKFVLGEADGLLWDAGAGEVRGARLSDGRQVRAAMTVVATGAWTGKLVDLRGVASARGMCMAYVEVSREEEEAMKACPVLLNFSNGMFFFPPNKRVLKVARHAYGYSNPTQVPAPLFASEAGEISISLPAFPDMLPKADQTLLQDFLHASVPMLDRHSSRTRRPFTSTRICWYLDSKDGEFLVCRHPKAPSSLFLATAGSGHGYKFLPVLGERIVDVLDGTDVRENGGIWTDKWKFPTVDPTSPNAEVWCEDGSRAGDRGCELQAALRKGRTEERL